MGFARHLAVWMAAIVFFVLGAIWYSALATQWLAAIGKTVEQTANLPVASPIPYVIGFAAILVMCYTLALLIQRLQAATGLFEAFITTGPQRGWMRNRFQLIAGAPERIPL